MHYAKSFALKATVIACVLSLNPALANDWVGALRERIQPTTAPKTQPLSLSERGDVWGAPISRAPERVERRVQEQTTQSHSVQRMAGQGSVAGMGAAPDITYRDERLLDERMLQGTPASTNRPARVTADTPRVRQVPAPSTSVAPAATARPAVRGPSPTVTMVMDDSASCRSVQRVWDHAQQWVRRGDDGRALSALLGLLESCTAQEELAGTVYQIVEHFEAPVWEDILRSAHRWKGPRQFAENLLKTQLFYVYAQEESLSSGQILRLVEMGESLQRTWTAQREAGALEALGWLQLKAPRRAIAAESSFRAAIRIDDRKPSMFEGLIFALLEQNKLDQALREAERYGVSSEVRGLVRAYQASAALNRRQFQQAYDLASAARALGYDDPSVVETQAWASWGLGKSKEALQYAQEALATLPLDAPVASASALERLQMEAAAREGLWASFPEFIAQASSSEVADRGKELLQEHHRVSEKAALVSAQKSGDWQKVRELVDNAQHEDTRKEGREMLAQRQDRLGNSRAAADLREEPLPGTSRLAAGGATHRLTNKDSGVSSSLTWAPGVEVHAQVGDSLEVSANAARATLSESTGASATGSFVQMGLRTHWGQYYAGGSLGRWAAGGYSTPLYHGYFGGNEDSFSWVAGIQQRVLLESFRSATGMAYSGAGTFTRVGPAVDRNFYGRAKLLMDGPQPWALWGSASLGSVSSENRPVNNYTRLEVGTEHDITRFVGLSSGWATLSPFASLTRYQRDEGLASLSQPSGGYYSPGSAMHAGLRASFENQSGNGLVWGGQGQLIYGRDGSTSSFDLGVRMSVAKLVSPRMALGVSGYTGGSGQYSQWGVGAGMTLFFEPRTKLTLQDLPSISVERSGW